MLLMVPRGISQPYGPNCLARKSTFP